jgi:hypothetical protein
MGSISAFFEPPPPSREELPPGDRLALVAEWPAQGIALSRHEIEADPFRRSAGQAHPIWD